MLSAARISRFIETALVAFFAGTVSCALTVLLVSGSDPPMPPAAPTGVQQVQLDRVAESLARIEAEIPALHLALASRPTRRELVGDSSIGESLAIVLERLDAFDAASVMRAQATGVGWADSMDASLASSLIEHGKTPYDEGVTPLLSQATRELSGVEDRFSESRRLLKERDEQLMEDAVARAGGQLEFWAPPVEERRALEDAHIADRDAVLARFRQAIVALDSRRHE